MEQIVNGGRLVVLNDGTPAVEAVPGARRGLVVLSASSHMDGAKRVRGCYRLTQRAIAGTDLWRVRRQPPVIEEDDML